MLHWKKIKIEENKDLKEEQAINVDRFGACLK